MPLRGKSGCDRHQRAYKARSIYHPVLYRKLHLCLYPPILLLRSLLHSSLRTHLHEALWIFTHLLYCLTPLEVSHTEGRNLDSC